MLFFNPGKRYRAFPFIGNKINIFDPDVAELYNFSIDQQDYEEGSPAMFFYKGKDDLSASDKDRIVIDKHGHLVQRKNDGGDVRNYDMSYNTGVYDFPVHMEVQLMKFGEYLVLKYFATMGIGMLFSKKRSGGVYGYTVRFNKSIIIASRRHILSPFINDLCHIIRRQFRFKDIVFRFSG